MGYVESYLISEQFIIYNSDPYIYQQPTNCHHFVVAFFPTTLTHHSSLPLLIHSSHRALLPPKHLNVPNRTQMSVQSDMLIMERQPYPLQLQKCSMSAETMQSSNRMIKLMQRQKRNLVELQSTQQRLSMRLLIVTIRTQTVLDIVIM